MPVVPVSNRNSVGIAEVTDAKLRPADFASSAEGVGRAAQGLGQSIGEFAQVQDHIDRIHDDAAAKALDNEAATRLRALLYEGDDAYYKKEGFNAATARQPTEDAMKAMRAELLQRATTDRQRLAFGQNFDQRVSQELTGMARYSIGQVAREEERQSIASVENYSRDAVLSAGDPEKFAAFMAGATTEIETRGENSGWAPQAIAEAKEKVRASIVTQVIMGKLNSGDIAGARQFQKDHAADLPKVAADLAPDFRAAEARQKAALALGKSEASAAINVFQKRLTDGVPVPDADIEAAIATAKQYGLESEVYDLSKMHVLNRVNRETKSWTPDDFTTRINALATKIAKAGDKANPADVIEHDHLETLRNARRTQFNTDPLGFGAENGMNVTPLDYTPASMQKRVNQATALARQTGGRPIYLTPDEAEKMRDQASSGGAGKLQVLEQLSRFPGRAASDAAKQVLPNDPMFARIVGLPRNYRASVIKGAELRAGKGDLLKPANDQDKALIARQEAAVGRGLSVASGADVNAVLEIARNMTATLMSEQGVAYSPKLYWETLNLALGARGTGANRTGGMGLWNGAAYVLPEKLTQRDFELAVTKRATAKDGGPVNPDGSAADLKRAFPVAIGGDVYRFETASGAVVQKKGGGAFVVKVWKP